MSPVSTVHFEASLLIIERVLDLYVSSLDFSLSSCAFSRLVSNSHSLMSCSGGRNTCLRLVMRSVQRYTEGHVYTYIHGVITEFRDKKDFFFMNETAE